MSYASRGPRRPQSRDGYPGNDSGPGSVRAARERLTQAQSRLRQHTTSPEGRDIDPSVAQLSSIGSPATAQLQPPVWKPFPSPQPSPQSPQWPLSREFGPPALAPSSGGIPPRNPARRVQNSYGVNQPSFPSSRPLAAQRTQMSEISRRAIPDLSGLDPPTIPSRPVTTSSQTTDSSLGTIPDFPIPSSVPVPPPNLNSNASGGRRARSSYYSQYSNVAPIREEGGRASIKSYASSNVIPNNAPDFYFDTTPSDDEDVTTRNADQIPRSTLLVRQASLGKRLGKPALTSIKGRSKPPSPPERQADEGTKTLALSSSDESLVKKTGAGVMGAFIPSRKPASNPTGDPAPGLRQVPKSMLAERVGSKKPADLDVEKVRSQEARGSLTSLPDLIRRATRLAANLDRGKTASRLGMDWMIKEESNIHNLDEKQGPGGALRLQSPASSTPRTEWPSNRSANPILQVNNGTTPPPKGKSQRRCCGLPRTSFIGLIFLLILLVSAAIIIPVALIVIPKMNAAPSNNTSCATKATCSNSGNAVVLADGSCGCVCVNGFQGPTCSKPSDAGCTTVSVPGMNKVTTGTMVAELLQLAENFSIPLDSRALAVEFAQANLTCASENALVNLPSSSRNAPRQLQLMKRQSAITTNGIIVGAPTGDVASATVEVQLSSTVTVVPSATSSGAATAQPPVGTPSGSNPVLSLNGTTQNFAKIGILFVLQDSKALSTTTNAQEKLGGYMTTALQDGVRPTSASKVSLGSGYYINMWDWTVTLKNGTVYGAGWNGTATTIKGRLSRALA